MVTLYIMIYDFNIITGGCIKMRLKQHLDIGNKVLEDNIISTFKVNRVAYLFGTIAPDLNCIYPAHRLRTTESRFSKKLKIAGNASTSLIKSFMLGVITHYVCDYFCYAHNIESLGLPHKKYEDNLYKYYESHLDEMEDAYDNLLDHWLDFKAQSKKKCVKNNCLTSESHVEFIMNQVKNMNKLYMNSDRVDKKVGWTDKIEQMQKDIEYATFMVERVLTITLEPFKCLVGEY